MENLKKLGKLIQELPNGKTIVLEENKAFPLLQYLKKKHVASGADPKTLKVKYQ